jgi:glutathione S-transferase
MLELYHHGSSVCAAKVRLSLEEKQIGWQGHYVDILKGEQFTAAYRALNPKAVVPTVVHDGFVVTESAVICEYLEDVFQRTPLRPKDPQEHVRQLYWSKAVDEELHPACAELTFAASHRFTVLKLGEQKVAEFLNSTPAKSVTATWHERKKAIVREGFKAPGVGAMVQLYDTHLQRMEAYLSTSPWLAGESFSLADTAMLPYVMRLEMLHMSATWGRSRLPRVERWLAACQNRPSFQLALWKWMPSQLTEDLKNNGIRSWPEVARILGIA